MSEARQSNLPLIFLIIWYLLAMVGTGGMLMIGLMFGSEVYRGRPMPLVDWVVIAGPFLVNVVLLILTIWLWNSGRRQATYAVFGLSILGFLGFLVLGGALGI